MFTIHETDNFLSDVEESALWILESNIDQSEELASRKADEFQTEIEALKIRLQRFPDSGEEDSVKGVRKFPLYGGRYSLKWIVEHSAKRVTLIAVTDSKYPSHLRSILFEE